MGLRLFVTIIVLAGLSVRAEAQLMTGDKKISGSIAEIQADNNATGSDYQIQGEYRPFDHHLVYAGAEQLTRAYNDGTKLTDHAYDIGNVSNLSSRVYLEDRISYAPNATFLPVWGAQTVPHYVFKNGTDISLAIRYGHYATDDVGMVSPTWFYPFTDYIFVSAAVNIVRTWHTIYSEQAYFQYGFDDHHRIRLTGATGRAVEGDNLEGDFTSGALGYKWISKRTRIELEPNVSVYRGSVRNENALGLNAGWTFR